MENENSVCFIAKINKLNPIEGADKIELATINGWTSVVKKNIHKEGDLILCITTDAVIPEDQANLWGVNTYLRKGSRVRTVKLKGVYSECVLIPLNDVRKSAELSSKVEFFEGEDLMNTLEIFKYEPPVKNIQLSNGRKHKYHQNPNFHIYYKFPNQKNTPNMFNEDDEVAITRKIHGTNARYGIVKKSKLTILDRIKKFFGVKYAGYEYIYGSHNVEKGSDSQGFYSTDVWAEVAKKYDIKNKLWNYLFLCPGDINKGSGIIIYGEIYGQGIQGDKYSYGFNTKKLAGFDVEINGTYCGYHECDHVFKMLSIPTVPLLHYGKWSKEIQDSFVNNQFIEGTKTPHEGVVVKHVSGDRHKVSKVINPDYHIFAEKWVVPDSH